MTVRPTTRIVAILLALAASACWGLALVVAKAALDSGIAPVRLSGIQICKFLGCSRRNSHERLEIVLGDSEEKGVCQIRHLSLQALPRTFTRRRQGNQKGSPIRGMGRALDEAGPLKCVEQGRHIAWGHVEHRGKLALGHRLSLSEFPDQMGPHLGQPTLLQSLLHVGAHEVRNEQELRQCILSLS